MERVIHPLSPVYDAHSRVLILGTMASVSSRRAGFYYMHPQNRFFPVLATMFQEAPPQGPEARRAFLLRHGIALWDVVASCEITGSSDSSIRNPLPNDIPRLLKETGISTVFTTGRTAERLYQRLLASAAAVPCILLPSPSPANCAVPFNTLVERYSALILPAL